MTNVVARTNPNECSLPKKNRKRDRKKEKPSSPDICNCQKSTNQPTNQPKHHGRRQRAEPTCRHALVRKGGRSPRPPACAPPLSSLISTLSSLLYTLSSLLSPLSSLPSPPFSLISSLLSPLSLLSSLFSQRRCVCFLSLARARSLPLPLSPPPFLTLRAQACVLCVNV